MIYVASYCRVSTDQEDQHNSFASQQRYFRDYIQHHPDWELYAVYADEGITGTSTKKRTQFNRMIEDAYAGKFQLILTKEVSRFSRNILDTIAYTRELKALGVGVRFFLDGICTLDSYAELYLSIMASMAQDESRKTSSRVTWGQTRQMEKGVVFGHSLLGYTVHQGRLTVEPDGAELVRRIFELYAVEQISTAEIARILTREGHLTHHGNEKWTANGVLKILKNEKYVGDLLQKKTYTPDYLTHEKRRNTGEIPFIRIENHHTPIVGRELWNMAQARMAKNRKQTGSSGQSNRYIFSGKIHCGQCGGVFVGRFRYTKDGIKTRRWCCNTAARDGSAACSVGKLVRDDDAMHMLRTALMQLSMDRDAIIAHVTALALEGIRADKQELSEDPKRLEAEITQIQRKKEAAMDACFSGQITMEDLNIIQHRYAQQLKQLKLRLEQVQLLQAAGQNLEQRKAEITVKLQSILCVETESDIFCKSVLEQLTVWNDRHMELRLQHLTQVFYFTE